jgi:hypothetical protein
MKVVAKGRPEAHKAERAGQMPQVYLVGLEKSSRIARFIPSKALTKRGPAY